MAGLLDVSAKPKTHCSLLARRPLLYFGRTYCTIRAGSFFERSCITLDKRLYVTYIWSQGTKVNSVERQVQIGEKTVIQLFQYLRDVCFTKLLSTPVELGGPGVIVQIDESLFNHKSKYNRGRRASKEQWVFGLADISSKPAITYMETVDKRDAATLLPIIQHVVKPGTIIHLSLHILSSR
jgi:hypothetical protein